MSFESRLMMAGFPPTVYGLETLIHKNYELESLLRQAGVSPDRAGLKILIERANSKAESASGVQLAQAETQRLGSQVQALTQKNRQLKGRADELVDEYNTLARDYNNLSYKFNRTLDVMIEYLEKDYD